MYSRVCTGAGRGGEGKLKQADRVSVFTNEMKIAARVSYLRALNTYIACIMKLRIYNIIRLRKFVNELSKMYFQNLKGP